LRENPPFGAALGALHATLCLALRLMYFACSRAPS
jgi:hypothetical protein